MAMTHDYMDYLNEKVGICPAGSQEELQAADTIADLMRQHDVEPSIEEFDAKSFGGTVAALLYALMFVGIVLGGIGVSVLTVIGFVLAVGPAALFILKYFGHDLISPLGPTTRSQNVVAFHKACGPNVIKGNRPIVIVAHYDSPHENVLRTSPVAPYIPLIWRVSKYCVLVVGVCMLFQPLAFLPEVFRRFMWVIGILAALPLAVLGVTGVLEHFSDCTDGANDNKSGVAAMLGVLENVRPSGLESVHGVETVDDAVEAIQQAAEAAAFPAAQPEAPVEGFASEQYGEPEPASAPEPVAPAPAFVPAPVETYGIRHGADVVKSLGMLPEDCEVEYVEPEPVVVPVPAPATASEPARPAARTLITPAPVAADFAPSEDDQEPEFAPLSNDGFDVEAPAPYTEDKPSPVESVLSFFRSAKDRIVSVGKSAGQMIESRRAADGEQDGAQADDIPVAEYEELGEDQPVDPADASAAMPTDNLIPLDDKSEAEPEPASEAEPEQDAPSTTAVLDADQTASATACIDTAADQTAEVTAVATPLSDTAVQQPADDAKKGDDESDDGAAVNFDGLSDGKTLDPDNTGLTAESDSDGTAPMPATAAPKPAAPDDPEWGKSTFRPQATDVARRATLFDLPDPSAAGHDPFGTDPNAPKVSNANTFAVPQGGVATQDSGQMPVQPVEARFETISAPSPEADAEFEALRNADAKRAGDGVFGKLKGLFGSSDKADDSDKPAKHGGWKGGAAPRAGLRMVDDDFEAGMVEGAPGEADLREAVLGLGDDDLISHDIWFVALGASDCDHAGMRAFLAEHRKQIRGSFVINLDSVGAGDLTMLSREGLLITRRADRRMLRMMSTIANDLHIPMGKAKYDWSATDATPAMLSSLRAMTIMGTDASGFRALSCTPDDVPENVIPEQAVAVAEAVTELIRRS